MVALDDADGGMLYARFFAQEGTASTFAALESVVRRYGRFCELYTDRGSHFCTTKEAGAGPDRESQWPSQPGPSCARHRSNPGPLAASPRAQRARLWHHSGTPAAGAAA